MTIISAAGIWCDSTAGDTSSPTKWIHVLSFQSDYIECITQKAVEL